MFNPFAAGKKIYSNGTHAATRGRVDPSGYIAREMRQQNQSQSRSGLAARALSKRTNNNEAAKRPNKPKSTAGQSFGGMNPLSNWMDNLHKPLMEQDARTQKVNQHAAHHQAVNNAVAQTQLPQPSASMKVNPNGQLDLPYNSDFAWQLLQGQQDANGQLLQLQLQEQQHALNYGANKRDAAINFNDLNRHILNSAAARGLAYSSGYGQNVSNAARDYNNYLSDLEQQNTLFNSGIDMSRTQIQNYLSDLIRQGALQQAQQLQGQAGGLGYGQGTAQPGTQINNGSNSGSSPSHHRSNGNGAATPFIDRLAGQGLNAQQILKHLASQGVKDLKPRQKQAVQQVRHANRLKHYAKTHKKGK